MHDYFITNELGSKGDCKWKNLDAAPIVSMVRIGNNTCNHTNLKHIIDDFNYLINQCIHSGRIYIRRSIG